MAASSRVTASAGAVCFALLLGSCTSHTPEPVDRKQPEAVHISAPGVCQQDGMMFFAEFSTNVNASTDGILWDEPESHYNSTLRKCFVHVRYVKHTDKDGITLQYNQVIDVELKRPIIIGYFSRESRYSDGAPFYEELIDTPYGDLPNYLSGIYRARKDLLFTQ